MMMEWLNVVKSGTIFYMGDAALQDKDLSVDIISIQLCKIDYANTESNNQGV